MRDLTQLFYKNHPRELATISSMLLQLDANVPTHGGVALAGGYLRDRVFGSQSKDMDFVFWGLPIKEFYDAVDMFRRRTDVEVISVHGDASYNGALEDVIPTVIKLRWDCHDVDLILYNADSLAAVLDHFDCTLNTFAASYGETFALTIAHYGEWGVCTRNVESDASPERVERFREMARQVDWEYIE